MNSSHIALIIQLLCCALSFPAAADAVKCRQPNGKVVISNMPCDEDAKTVATHRSDYISPQQRQAAAQDVERQKAFVARSESERVAPVQYSSSSQQPSNQQDVTGRIYACLMRVSATANLRPDEEARRKVGCYESTRGLANDCERSVGATMSLPSSSEAFYRGQCRSVSPN